MSESSDQPPDPISLSQDGGGTVAAASSSIASESVVPSLMQVYNTMIQSKTPEGPSIAAAASSNTVGGVSGTAAEWNAYTAATASGNTALPSIPPPPDPSVMYAKEGESRNTSNNARAAAQRAATTSNVAVASEPSSNRRALRRKRASPGSFRENSNNNDDSDSPSVTSSSKGGNKSRRKAKETDNRWSKRFSWPEDLHRDFVSAIFDVGLKHSSPSTILEHMPKHEQITSERVKSHLQKYRLHRIKSKKEFMTSYDAGLKKIGQGMFHGALSAGEVASLLTHRDMHEPPAAVTDAPNAPRPATVETDEVGLPNNNNNGVQSNGAAGSHKNGTPATAAATTAASSSAANANDVLTLPRLTEAEKQSPIGASMGYLMGLFFSLKQQLTAQRAAAKAMADQAPKGEAGVQQQPVAAAVFDSFVGGGPAAIATTSTTTTSTAPAVPSTLAITGSIPISTTTTASSVPPVVSNPSTRSNLEENNMMKREMQSQMAFQNKMRGLKEQELNKFRTTSEDIGPAPSHYHHVVNTTAPSLGASAFSASTIPNPMGAHPAPTSPTAIHVQHQGAGEMDAGDGRNRGLSIGNAEDFWNTDVMDEQLFEFLMSE